MRIVVPVPEMIELEIGENVYEITEPTLDQLEMVESNSGKGEMKATIEFLISSGLPKEVTKKLGIAGLKAIFAGIMKEVKGKK